MTSVLCITCAIGPYFSAAFSLSSSDSINISVTITSAPASAKARASARPRPRDAPVTTATLPANKLAHDDRSEEHTSELQSRFDLVCRLLLEKKKAINSE